MGGWLDRYGFCKKEGSKTGGCGLRGKKEREGVGKLLYERSDWLGR